MKIVLAYSGGLDTSVLLLWLKEKYNAEMIAFCANIGQEEELNGLDKKARQTGASKLYIDDLQEEFARDFIFPMIQAGAIYENQYFLGTSIARPLIAKRMVEIAQIEKADAVGHGATGKGNDQVRFELTAAALAPDLEVIAPWRDENFRNQFPGRADLSPMSRTVRQNANTRARTTPRREGSRAVLRAGAGCDPASADVSVPLPRQRGLAGGAPAALSGSDAPHRPRVREVRVQSFRWRLVTETARPSRRAARV